MSSKTPTDNTEKTALAHKALFIVGILILLFVLLANPTSRLTIECLNFHTPTDATMTVGTNKVALDTVKTEAALERGLSGRPCIKNNQAMLFVFDANDNSDHCFWMKDMRFTIDMIWLDSNKKVVDEVVGVEPETYPNQFCPRRPTQYVLETKAYQAKKLGIAVGDVVRF